MSEPFILGIGTAVPAQEYSQDEIFDRFLAPFFGERSVTRTIFDNAGVGFRHTVVDGTYYGRERRTQERNERYLDEAIPLGEQAIRNCLQAAQISPREIDDFLVVSCTGIDTPGLDLLLAGRMGLRPDLDRTCVLGMGCYGAFPALQRARQAVSFDPGKKVLVLALELCSLHFQPQDKSIENVVSSALFSDGAAAVVVAGRENPIDSQETPRDGSGWDYIPLPGLVDSATYCDYQTFEHMSFHLTDHGFHMHLSAYVPDVLAAKIETVVDGLLEKYQLDKDDVRFWGVHPGSSKILDYVASRLGLKQGDLNCSREVLYRYGNMSSATILFVLDEIQHHSQPRPGDWGFLMAFGPGLTLQAALVQWK
jgi:alkylresorcinol/alkylpyrone synthase